jgi:hypothetical protein
MKLILSLVCFSFLSLSAFAESRNCDLVTLNDTLEYDSSELEGLMNISKKQIAKIIAESTPKSYHVQFSSEPYTNEKQLSVNFQLKYGVFTGFVRICSAMVTIIDYRTNELKKVVADNLNANCAAAAASALKKLPACK